MNINWDEYFMAIAILVSKRSKDPSTQVGSVIVNDKNIILGSGYNGMPRGITAKDNTSITWCKDKTKSKLEQKYLYVVHSEANCILNSSTSVNGSRIYCTLFPCNECTKLIIQSGITSIIYLEDKYPETDEIKASKIMLDTVNIPYQKFKTELTNINIEFTKN